MRVWRNSNPHTLLIGMQSGAAAVEDSLVVAQKVKQNYHTTEISFLGMYPKELKTTQIDTVHQGSLQHSQ